MVICDYDSLKAQTASIFSSKILRCIWIFFFFRYNATVHLIRLQYRPHISSKCTGKPENTSNLLYCNSLESGLQYLLCMPVLILGIQKFGENIKKKNWSWKIKMKVYLRLTRRVPSSSPKRKTYVNKRQFYTSFPFENICFMSSYICVFYMYFSFTNSKIHFCWHIILGALMHG